ncbi:MAG: hypothetical protein KKA78_19055, partial [Alphaproteobacteria bacterium]|nr:hypothetical protein [Alphaproteobacteria bacterium]
GQPDRRQDAQDAGRLHQGLCRQPVGREPGFPAPGIGNRTDVLPFGLPDVGNVRQTSPRSD